MENNQKHEIEIDLKQIFGLLLSKALYISVIGVVCAILAFSYFKFVATEKFTSTTQIFVIDTAPLGLQCSPITPGAPGPVAAPWATFPRSNKPPLWPDSTARARVLTLLASFPPHRLSTSLPLVPSAGDTGVPAQEAPSTPAPHLAQTRAGPFFLPISAPREGEPRPGPDHTTVC